MNLEINAVYNNIYIFNFANYNSSTLLQILFAKLKIQILLYAALISKFIFQKFGPIFN